MTLNERIASKQKQIEKVENQVAKMLAAWAAGKDYLGYVCESLNKAGIKGGEFERKQHEIAYLTKELNAMLDKNKLIEEKAASRGEKVQVILDYLETWKQRVIKWHEAKLADYFGARGEAQRANLDNLDTIQRATYNKMIKEGYFEKNNVRWGRDNHNPDYRIYKDAREAYENEYAAMNEYRRGKELNMAKLNTDLDREKERKYNDLIDRVLVIVGQITDARHISIGNQNGEINGFILGTRGKAAVDTIGAGGYNIQCFHFRVLVKEVK